MIQSNPQSSPEESSELSPFFSWHKRAWFTKEVPYQINGQLRTSMFLSFFDVCLRLNNKLCEEWLLSIDSGYISWQKSLLHICCFLLYPACFCSFILEYSRFNLLDKWCFFDFILTLKHHVLAGVSILRFTMSKY